MTQKAFIVWSHPLFHETVRLLLSSPGIEIVGSASDRDAAREAIARLQPGVIIVEEVLFEESIEKDILDFLGVSKGEPRVARLSLEDNQVFVYQRERRTITSREDLLAVFSE